MTKNKICDYSAILDSANAYKFGINGSVDYNSARRMFRMCARSSDRKIASEGQYNLGLFYFYGYGVPLDYKRAFELFMKSIILYQNKKALIMLGDMYRYGYFVTKNDTAAIKLYLIANEGN